MHILTSSEAFNVNYAVVHKLPDKQNLRNSIPQLTNILQDYNCPTPKISRDRKCGSLYD